MVVIGGAAVSYARGTPVTPVQQEAVAGGLRELWKLCTYLQGYLAEQIPLCIRSGQAFCLTTTGGAKGKEETPVLFPSKLADRLFRLQPLPARWWVVV